jgi:hypothetical protein
MKQHHRMILTAVILLCACSDDTAQQSADVSDATQSGPAACDAPAARQLAGQLGARMKLVSLLAPDAGEQLRKQYGDLASAQLLDAWAAAPSTAPGRDVSSPWPERIAIDSISGDVNATCTVYGDVLYATSTDSVAARKPIVITIGGAEPPRITAVTFGDAPVAPAPAPASSLEGEPAAEPGSSAQREPDADAAAAVAVIRSYYDAIDGKRYRDAYMLWSDGGRSSGQTYEQFAAGFANTAHVSVQTGTPGRIEPAAGSRYIDVPVTVTATTDANATQHFTGAYQLRRSVVDGSTAAQRAWRIYSANISRHQ